jgi:metallophosphoesterase superfamily enzyme
MYQKFRCVNCGANPTNYSHTAPAAPRGAEAVVEHSVNRRTHTATVPMSEAPTTLDEWIAMLDIDLDEWSVTKASAGRWEGFIKNSQKQIEKTPLFKFAVEVVRRHPVIESPAVRPVHINISYTPLSIPVVVAPDESWGRALIIPDTHHGFIRDTYTRKLTPLHDRRAISIAMSVAEVTQPDKVILVGDCLDLAEFSKKFVRSSEFERTFQPTIVELAWTLAKLRTSCPDAEIIYMEGNHEKRFRESVLMDMKELEGVYAALDPEKLPVLSVANYLGLDGLGINWEGPYPKARVQLNNRMVVTHGHTVRSKGGATTRALLQGLDCNMVMGHVHRLEQAAHTFHGTGDPIVYVATSVGTLAHIDGRVPSGSATENWQQGFGMVAYEIDGDRSFTTLHPITAGFSIVEGEAYVGDDYTEQLVDETRCDELSLSFDA